MPVPPARRLHEAEKTKTTCDLSFPIHRWMAVQTAANAGGNGACFELVCYTIETYRAHMVAFPRVTLSVHVDDALVAMSPLSGESFRTAQPRSPTWICSWPTVGIGLGQWPPCATRADEEASPIRTGAP